MIGKAWISFSHINRKIRALLIVMPWDIQGNEWNNINDVDFQKWKKVYNGSCLFIGPKEEIKREQRSGDLSFWVSSMHLLCTPATVVISQINVSCLH